MRPPAVLRRLQAALGAMDLDFVSRILFPAPPSSYSVDSFSGELIWVPRSLNPQTSSPEDCIPCLFLRCRAARFLVIYLHSNAEDLGRCHMFLRQVRDRFQVHVLAAEYPGYGICPGSHCDERGATESALTAFRFAREVLRWPLERILFLGRSIGTGPAISLAVEHLVKGVALVSPFLSVREVCRDALGPVSYLIEERFPNKDHMPLIRSPVLVVHGQKDNTIPFRHGRQLFDACRVRKRLVSPPEMDHNANLLLDSNNFVLPMLEFFGMPACGMETEMHVPSWAFDKRLSPFYLSKPVAQPNLLNPLFGACTACTACSKCANAPSLDPVTMAKTSWDGDLVEETITGAIEHVLGSGRKDTVWSETDSSGNLIASSYAPVSEEFQKHRHRPLDLRLPMQPIDELTDVLEELAGHVEESPQPISTIVLPLSPGQELPMPPSDDAVPSAPHTTVRRYPGRQTKSSSSKGDSMQQAEADDTAIDVEDMPMVESPRPSMRPLQDWRTEITKDMLPQTPLTLRRLEVTEIRTLTSQDFVEECSIDDWPENEPMLIRI